MELRIKIGGFDFHEFALALAPWFHFDFRHWLIQAGIAPRPVTPYRPTNWTTCSGFTTATADNLWKGRERRGWKGRAVTIFPQDTSLKAPKHQDTVELSTQLQAWMALEAAHAVDAGSAG